MKNKIHKLKQGQIFSKRDFRIYKSVEHTQIKSLWVYCKALLQWYLKRYISQRFARFYFTEISKLVGENRAKLKQIG